MDKPSIVITVKDIEEIKDANPERINIDPKNVEKGLAKLALTLVELIRKLLEKQAMRRIEAGSLSDEEVERIGETLLKLENKIQELKEIFGLKDEELNLNLGPLGDLM
ncbi:MAG: gas vesicle protein K [Nitrospirota bacterium]